MEYTLLFVRWSRCFVFLVVLLTPLAAGTASAVKLLEAKVTVGAVPVLQGAGGTVRLEQPQLSASAGHEVFFVPEPGVLWQLGSGVVLLVLLSTRRRSAASRPLSRPGAAPAVPDRSHCLPRSNAMESRSKRRGWSVQGAGLVFMLLALAAGPAVAQVPQDMTFSGRFVDDEGAPLVGPALVYLAIVDALTGGTTLYIEEHSVTLDAQGNFSVLLGTGADIGGPFPPFGAALFSDVERYVQVLLTFSGPPSILFQALTPRVPLASVPWALVAEQAIGVPNSCEWVYNRAQGTHLSDASCPVDKFVFDGECAFMQGGLGGSWVGGTSVTINSGGGALVGGDVTAGVAIRCLRSDFTGSDIIDARALCCSL